MGPIRLYHGFIDLELCCIAMDVHDAMCYQYKTWSSPHSTWLTIFCRWCSKSIFLYETLAIGSVTSLVGTEPGTCHQLSPTMTYFREVFMRHQASVVQTHFLISTSYPLFFEKLFDKFWQNYPDNKVHGANTGPTWDRQDPAGPHVGHVNLAIRVWLLLSHLHCGSNHVSQNASF